MYGLYWLEMVPFLTRRLCAGLYLHVAALHTVFKANVSLNILIMEIRNMCLAHSNKSNRQQLFAFSEPCFNIS